MAIGNQSVVSIVIRAFDQTKGGLTTPIKNVKDFEKAVTALAPAMLAVAAAAGAAFLAMARHTINAADEAGKLSQKIGVSVETLTGLQHALALAGGSADTLKIGLKHLNTLIADAAAGNEKAQNTFQQIGVSFTDLNGKAQKTETVLEDLAAVFGKSEDGANKSALAVQLFSKSGLELIPFLNGGRDGLKELTAEAEQLGVTFTGESAAAAELFNDSLTRLKAAAMGMVNQVVVAFLPSLAALAEGTFEWIKQSGVMQATALTLIQIFRGLAVAVRAVYDAVVSGLEVFAALATLIGSVIVNRIDAAKQAFTALTKIMGDSEAQILDTTKSLGQLAGIMAKAATGNFLGAWSDFATLSGTISTRLGELKSNVPKVFKELEGIASNTIKKDIDDAVAIGGELGARLQKRWADFGAFTFDVFEPKDVNAPKLGGMKKGEPIKLIDEAEIKRQVGLLEKMNEQARRQAELFRTLAQEGLRGSAALTAAEGNRFAKQLEQIDKAGLDEDEYYAAREMAAVNHQQNLAEIERNAATERGNLYAEFNSAFMDQFQQQEAAEAARLQAQLDRIAILARSEDEAREMRDAAEQASLENQKRIALARQQSQLIATATMFGQMAYIAQAFGKKGATAYKVFASAQALIAAYLGATKALAEVPFPFNFAAAAVTLAAGLANVAVINSTPTGMAHDGMMSVPQDGSYVLQGGEMVVARDDSSRLIDYLESNRGGGQNVTVNVDGRELFRLIMDGQRDGRLQLA